jgi:hypothetical protein
MIGDPAQPVDCRFARGLDAEGGKLKPGTKHERRRRANPADPAKRAAGSGTRSSEPTMLTVRASHRSAHRVSTTERRGDLARLQLATSHF